MGKDDRHFDPKVAVAKSRLAGLSRGASVSQAQIDEARAELKAANLEKRIREDVDKWPPLSAERRAVLASLLLRPDGAVSGG